MLRPTATTSNTGSRTKELDQYKLVPNPFVYQARVETSGGRYRCAARVRCVPSRLPLVNVTARRSASSCTGDRASIPQFKASESATWKDAWLRYETLSQQF